MNKFYVYLADIHGEDIDIEKNILKGIAQLKKGKRSRRDEANRILKEAKDADAIGVRHTRITGDIIKGLTRCRIIARFGGGYDNIDVKAATKNGIIVTFVPDYCSEAVAEHALTLALLKIREFEEFKKRIKRNFWGAQGVKIEMAKDATLGIIGLGRIGGALSKKAGYVGFNVIAYDPFISDGDFRRKKAKRIKKIDELFKTADIISLNVPLTKKGQSRHPTFRMIGEKQIKMMRDGVYIINVCRGEVIDTNKLIVALKNKKVSGLATDLIEGEPIQNTYLKKGDNPVFDKLKNIPGVTITPHCAFVSTRSIKTVKEKGAMEIRRVLQEGFPRTIAWINPEVKKMYLKRFK